MKLECIKKEEEDKKIELDSDIWKKYEKKEAKNFNSVRDAAKFYGVHEHTARTRIGRGWSIEDALKTKKSRSIKENYIQW